MELLGFTLIELAVLAAVLLAIFAALSVASRPRPGAIARPALVRLLIAILLVAVIGASWAAIRYANTKATEATMRAARSHGVEVEKLRRKPAAAAVAEAAKKQKRVAAGSIASHAARISRDEEAEQEQEQAEQEEEEQAEQEEEEEQEEPREQRAETEEELFTAALLEGESEAEYAARRQRADRVLSLRRTVEGMVGGTYATSASLMQEPRNVSEAARWVGGDAKLSRAITMEGLRSHEASTLFAKEDYAALEQANHGYGEGMDLRYVDPSLRNFDYAFAAYDEAPLPSNPLPGNTPMLF